MKTNIFSKGKRLKVNSSYFYGDVNLLELSSGAKIQEAKIYHVCFKGGARTKLHLHSGGQTLIGTKGRGRLDFYSKTGNASNTFRVRKTKQVLLRQGDVAYIPPKTLHAHGGIKDHNFSHIAINFKFGGREPKTSWFDLDSKRTATKIT